jgi:GNAT superfamily N-acetyltransferase
MPLWKEHDLQVEALIPDVRAGRYHLAMLRGSAAGTLKLQDSDLSIWPDAEPDAALYLHRLAVRRHFAGRGVSVALLTSAADVARAAGRRYLRLDCDAARVRLVELYLSAGFRHHSDHMAGAYRVARFEKALS